MKEGQSDELSLLIEAMRRGEERAWRDFDRQLRPFVVSRVRRAIHSRGWLWLQEDDTTQEVMFRFLEALRQGRFQYRDRHQLEGYLVRTLFFVSQERRVGEEREEASDREPVGESVSPPSRECVERFLRALGSLAPARREVMVKSLLGLKPSEVALAMSRTPNAVSILKYEALRDLRARLGEEGFFDDCSDLAERGADLLSEALGGR